MDYIIVIVIYLDIIAVHRTPYTVAIISGLRTTDCDISWSMDGDRVVTSKIIQQVVN